MEIFTNETIIICTVSVYNKFSIFRLFNVSFQFFTLSYGNVQSLDLSLTNFTVFIKILLVNFFFSFSQFVVVILEYVPVWQRHSDDLTTPEKSSFFSLLRHLSLFLDVFGGGGGVAPRTRG